MKKKHIDEDHEGNVECVKFTWKVLMKHKKPLRRQLHEAVNIDNKSPGENLSSKREFHSQRIKRINLESQFDCKTCGSMSNSPDQFLSHMKIFTQSSTALSVNKSVMENLASKST